MSPAVLELARLGAKLLLVMAIFVPLERAFPIRAQRILRRELLPDLGYYFIGSLIPKLLLIAPLSALAWLLHRAVPSPWYAAMGQLPTWLRLCGAMVVGEVGYYWGHRWMHSIPALWRFHAVHHSAEQMDWLVNTRAHPVDVFFGRFCGLVPIYVLGLAQATGSTVDSVPVLVALIGSLWGFFVHANLRFRFGWLEGLVATPAFHHWHHTKDGPDVVNKNFAAMLPFVDRLFGTFYLPSAVRPVRYGIDGPMPPDLAGQLLYPLWRQTDAVRSEPAARKSEPA